MRRKSTLWVWFAVLAIVAGGVYLRAREITASCPNGDEGESAINALTILQCGLPRGDYLGLPIYENCLIEPWPENPEYEFRDSSYSPSGLAIYHGWLPLYAMAGSMKAFGVTPDAVTAVPMVQHTEAEIRQRVIAARLPSLVFSVVFLVFLFLTAYEMFGLDAAFAALVVGVIGRPLVYMGHEARYYSATLTALSTACCWAMWRCFKYGRWPDYLIAALLIALLFYTHMLACAVVCAMFVGLSPGLLKRSRNRRRRDGLIKIAATGLIVIAAVVPWLILSGFLTQHTHLPPARLFLSFPADLIYYPLVHEPFLIFPLLGLAWLIIVLAFRQRLPRGATLPLARHHRQILFLMTWIAVGILAFTMLIPAASYFYKRLTLAVIGPGIVWGAIIIAAGARAVARRYSMLLTPIVFAAIVALDGMAYIPQLEANPPIRAYQAIAKLRQMTFDPRTKIYCTPNDQLSILYLAGFPIQSVAPVRKSFLDTYPGPILIIDSGFPHLPLPTSDIVEVARKNGDELSYRDADALAMPMTTRLQRRLLAGKVASIDPQPADDPKPAPELAQAIEFAQLQRTADEIYTFERYGCNTPILREFKLHDWADWWPVFFYRFVDPPSRMGEKLNYAERIRSANAEVLPNAWVFLNCPPLATAAAQVKR